jgi:hypothetical protein
MEITSEIRGQHGLDLELADWNKLAGLPRVRSVHDVRELFYPGLDPDVEPHSLGTRRRDFFLSVSDDAYFSLYQFVLSEPARRFIDIQALLKTTKQEGKLMSMVMSHVSLWTNREPEKVSDRDNNKPALRKDLIPALRAKYGDKADDESQVLQQEVLNHVRENAKEFTSTTLEHYLHEYPSGNDDAYGARFKHAVWSKVLSIVTSFAGPTLQHKYIASLTPEETRKISPPTIAQTARDLICQIPEVANNPALQSTTAAERLLRMMQPVIAQWISEQPVDVSDLSETMASDAGVSPPTEVQDQEPIDFTLTGLNNLRKQHRRKSTISQQRAQVQQASLAADSHQPGDLSIALSSHATTGSGHWRKLASVRRGKRQP